MRAWREANPEVAGAGTRVSEAFKLGARVFWRPPEEGEVMTSRHITVYWSTT
jgi:hypothetical protein